MIAAHALAIAASYLIGAIPFGFLIAKMKGVDIRTKGSGNIGATNVFRTIGKGLGITTLALDVAKGSVASYVLPILAEKFLSCEPTQSLSIICACCAVAGHNWPIFLKFKGGKGIATTAGAVLGIAPAALGIALLTWLIILPAFRYVSLASITGAVSLATAGWFIYRDDGLLLPSFLTVLGVLAILRHRSNISRLLNGTENRFEFKKRS